MLTKIGRHFWLANAGSSVLPSMNVTTGYVPWRTIDSSDVKYFGDYIRNHSLSTRVTSITNTGRNGIALGNGTTPATEDDFTMESLITDGSIQFSSASAAYDSVNDVGYAYINMTITNTTSEDITISELGLFVSTRASDTKGGTVSTNYDYTVMVDHTILDTPITIAPNEAGIVQYRFEIDE